MLLIWKIMLKNNWLWETVLKKNLFITYIEFARAYEQQLTKKLKECDLS